MSKPEFVYVTYIETTPEKLWEALTSGDFTERYWFGVRLKSDWKVGSRFAMMRDGAENDAGEVIEYDSPRRLSYTFVNLSEKYRGERPARATFVLEPYGAVVKLTLTHEDFDEGSKMLPAISKGWPAILSNLKSMLETGRTLEVPFAALKMEEAG
ncbi:MAG: hypothetical protein QOD11_1368 [Bradyrhizobium sp.]|jgi:uncharacterized protein YndB with AHSA1/START domain|nr:hypothetical protein [Bradyrhizobium sp.]